jgi:hypothetical protein
VTVTDWHVEQGALLAEHFFDGIDERAEIDVVRIQLGNAKDATEARVTGLFPSAPRVDFDARVGVDGNDGGFRGSQCADCLADQIRIPRRVDDIEPLASVVEVNDRSFDGVFVVFLLFVEVANARAVVDAGLAADGARFHQQIIDQRGFAR